MSASANEAAVSVPSPTEERAHVLPFCPGEWAIWRLAGLRGAGFPAADVLKLAVPEYANAVDGLIAAEEKIEEAAADLRDALNSDLNKLRSEGRWNDKKTRKGLLDALHQLKSGRMVEASGESEGTMAALKRYQDHRERYDSLSAAITILFRASAKHVSKMILETASSKQFQEAVVWQNHHAWRAAICDLLRHPEISDTSKKRRQQEELVASYLQRYCVKNDTIGFFGPVGWAHFVPGERPTVITPGPKLLAARNIYFEAWGIDVLAATFARKQSLRPWFAPRRMPFIHVEAGKVVLPGSSGRLPPLELPLEQVAVLAACDGQRPARLISEDLLRAGVEGIASHEDVYRILEKLVQWGLVRWTLELPIQLRAEETLRRILQRVEGREADLPLQILDQFEAARDRVASAVGNPECLAYELNRLEYEFQQVTGEMGTRAAGQTYAARTLVYEDCRRNVEMEIGQEVLTALVPGLSLLLISIRWMTHKVAQLYRAAFHNIYDKLAAQKKSRIVNATDFWMKCDPILHKDGARIADQITPLLQDKWANILQTSGSRRVVFTYEDLRPQVEAAFSVPGPGWSFGRYSSPDVMIAASGVDAIRRGDFQIVIGEIHVGINCLMEALFIGQHPQRSEIHRDFMADFTQPRLIPVPTKNTPKLTARTNCEFVSSADYRLLFSTDACNDEFSKTVSISDFVVEKCGEELILRTRDDSLRFEIVDGLGEILSSLILHSFSILPPLPHSPRISVDRVTITRESWRFPVEAIPFAREPHESERFVAARRWMHHLGLPRFVFVKSPYETKPFYVDFDSPIFVNLFSKMIRRAQEKNRLGDIITVTEMLPTHEQLWLPDASGNSYTSELRLVLVDCLNTAK